MTRIPDTPGQIDITRQGRGRAVVLLHGSGGGARQWQLLAAELAPQRRVILPNLFGYGATPPWPEGRVQRGPDQAALVLAALAGEAGPIDLVGHSLGGTVALDLAVMLGPRLGRVAVFEPNALGLLDRPGYGDHHATARRLQAAITLAAARDDLRGAAALFSAYFQGPGVWEATPPARQDVLAEALRPNPAEWGVAMDPALRPGRWAAIRAPVLVLHAQDSPSALQAVAQVLAGDYPSWQTKSLRRGGHLAPILRPRDVNRLISSHLA